MKIFKHTALKIMFVLLGGTLPLKAEVRLSQIESYLNSMTTLQASFEQWDRNGTRTKGKLFLKKPGKIHMNYDKPSKLLILGDSETLFFIDRQSGDLSYMPISQSPAAFFLEANINFQNDFDIVDFAERDTLIYLTLRRKDNPDIGTLTLVFGQKKSLYLAQWIIKDAQENQTIVRLSGVKHGLRLNKSLFDSAKFLG